MDRVLRSQVPDLRSVAQDRGCETALEEAIHIIQLLLTDSSDLAVLVAEQQQTISNLIEQNKLLALAVANLSGGLGRQAVSLSLSTARKELPMPTTITVDTTNELLIVAFTDDHGDPTGTPGTLTGTSDNVAVASVGGFAANGAVYQASIAPSAMGSTNLSVTVTDDAGNAVPLPNPQPDGPQTFNDEATPIAVDVIAGPAASLALSVAAQ